MSIASPLKNSAVVFALFVPAALGGCGDSGEKSAPEEHDRITVFASIVPVEYLARRIGGPHIDTHSLVEPGGSPATYEPTSKQLALLAQAHAFFIVGVPVEVSLVPRIRRNFDSVEIVDVRDGIQLARPQSQARSPDDQTSDTNHHHEHPTPILPLHKHATSTERSDERAET